MVVPHSTAMQHTFLQASKGVRYNRPGYLNRNCACGNARKDPLPRNIVLVENPSDVTPSHVLWLESCCYNRQDSQYGDDGANRCTPEQRVATVLANSCAVLAAYCRADAVAKLVPEEQLLRFEGFVPAGEGVAGQSPDAAEQSSNTHTSSLPCQSDWLKLRAAKRQKILVGLVRASSDEHFVGTLDDIMIHPGLRRRGLGRRLVTKACTKLFTSDVTDIGACVTPGNEEFFNECGFTKDKFNSVAMSLDRSSPSGRILACGAELNVDIDARLMHDAIKMQESCKLQRVQQALLRYVIPA